MSVETTICPFCAEEINISAIKCKHCGEFLDQRSKSSSEVNVVAKEGCFLQTLNIGCAIAVGTFLLIFHLAIIANISK